ncbi:MAG: hypothetical protein V1913_07175 [Fibrobacterota bacterium]
MKKEYDFSKAVQGKFYRPVEQLEIPVYLEKGIRNFYGQRIAQRSKSMEQVVNMILKKEMEMLKSIGI